MHLGGDVIIVADLFQGFTCRGFAFDVENVGQADGSKLPFEIAAR